MADESPPRHRAISVCRSAHIPHPQSESAANAWDDGRIYGNWAVIVMCISALEADNILRLSGRLLYISLTPAQTDPLYRPGRAGPRKAAPAVTAATSCELRVTPTTDNKHIHPSPQSQVTFYKISVALCLILWPRGHQSPQLTRGRKGNGRLTRRGCGRGFSRVQPRTVPNMSQKHHHLRFQPLSAAITNACREEHLDWAFLSLPWQA